MEEIIRQQTVMMRRLVDDLLELERITHGHIALNPERVDLAECLQRAVDAAQSAVSTRRQQLSLRLPSEPVLFRADGVRVDQIVGNLLTNASKYTEAGGRIELSGAKEGEVVVIRCKDNGQGILPEFQQKIFDPFVRERRTKLGYGDASIGLGLALVKQLTELHGGTISVESGGAGLGSEFTVRLPFVAPMSTPVALEPPVPPPASSPQRRVIVVVEDNPSVGAALKAALEQAGHSVHLFGDGPSTLAAVSTLKADVFVLDIGLPGMDGCELAAKLKEQPNTAGALCIAVSGLKQYEHGVAADGNFDHYFTKPVDVPALLALFDKYVSR
jgi:CheY-like chemotaxis protein/two-component sensor histidine kinase